jgi:hypothetical protein
MKMEIEKYFVAGDSEHARISGRNGHIGKIVEFDGYKYMVVFDDKPDSPEQFSAEDGYTANSKEVAERVSKFYQQES